MTIDDAFFYGVYLSQILLMSLYLPSRVLRRARALIETYPPFEFPKLYPVPVETIERMLRLYRNLNLGLLVLGLALLAAAWVSGYTFDSAWHGGDVPVPNTYPRALVHYTFFQLLPPVLFGYWQSRYFKRIRAAARNRIRTAEIKARRLFDFVSPTLLGTALAMYVGATVLLLVVGESPRRIAGMSVSGMSAYMLAVMTICNIALAGCLVWLLHGRKQDPYQTHEDRARMIRLTWQGVVQASILMSVLVGILGALIAFDLVRYGPLCASLFVQVVYVPLTLKFLVGPVGQENFEVYRADTNRATAVATYK